MIRKGIIFTLVLSMIAAFTACSVEQTETTTTASTITEATTVETTIEPSDSIEESVIEESETTETEVVIPDFDYESLPTFVITSKNLNDGVWDDSISNTNDGENKSPDLSWESVDGATNYVAYMIDTSAGNWIHLKVSDINTTSIEEGSLSSSKYVGPYPPSGTHDYVVYVFAMKSTPIRVRGVLDCSNQSLEKIFASLDVTESGETGNVISYGVLSGTYTRK